MKRWPHERMAVLSLSLLGWSAQSCYQPARSADDLSGYRDPVAGDDDGNGDDQSGSDDTGEGDGDGDQSGDGDGSSDGTGDGTDDGDSSGTDEGSEDAGTVEPPPRPTTLSFSVLTVSLDGEYSPRNIGAIWIEDSGGRFVKTLEEWARSREEHLYTFLDASGGDTTDAITSATLSDHRTHSVTWDLRDLSGSAAPDGDYRVMMELTDDNDQGATAGIGFTKGPSPLEVNPPDEARFVDMRLRYE